MSSSVPLVIPALATLVQDALPQGTQWWVGEVLPAYEASPGQVAGETTGIIVQVKHVLFEADEYAELGPTYRHEEHYNIQGCVISWSGAASEAETYATCLQEAYIAYSDFSVAISNNPTLGLTTPVPRISWPRQLSVTPGPDIKGYAQVEIEFEIYVEARVTSLS